MLNAFLMLNRLIKSRLVYYQGSELAYREIGKLSGGPVFVWYLYPTIFIIRIAKSNRNYLKCKFFKIVTSMFIYDEDAMFNYEVYMYNV